MIFERIESAGLAPNSYYLSSGNDTLIIDPRRDFQIYVDLAQKYGTRIKYILETHRNEDYIAGSRILANVTGAEVYHGQGLDWKYGAILENGQQIQIGKLRITVM